MLGELKLNAPNIDNLLVLFMQPKYCQLSEGNICCFARYLSALPVFLDEIVAPWGAILISVTLILLFGEIIPQSVCSRYGLAIGAAVAPFVRILVCICFPVAYPISKLLDALLGDGHEALFRRAELKTLVNLHGSEAGKGGELTRDETSIITGALELTEKTAKDSMTPMTETFAIDINEKLSRNLMESILEKGHSRVPNVVLTLEEGARYPGTVKNLLFINPEDEVLVKNVTIRKIPRVPEDMPLYNILNEFQKGHSHMAVVVRKHAAEPVNEGTELAKEVRLDVAGEGIHEEKKKKRKITFEREKNLTSITHNSSQVNSKSRRWHRETSLDILQLDDNMKFAKAGEAIGIITMEDVMEELLQEEIYDETD
ncbi:DUF21 domain-containing protein, partial [Asimina triloba]